MNYRDLQNISNLSQEILIEGANEEHNVLNRWPYTSHYLQESTELDEGAAGNVAARAQKLANQRKGQTPKRKKIYQGLADKAAARERGPFMGGTTRENMTSADRDAAREADAYHYSVFGERSKINQHGDSTYGPGGKPKGKKAERQKARGVSAESYDLYDIILSHLIDEGYADTFESAEAIMVNMSEDWRQSIVEAVDDTHPGHPNYSGPSQDPLSRASRAIGRGVEFAMGQQGAEVRAKQKGIPGNVFVKQSGPFSTKNVPAKGSFISDTEMKRRGQSTKPMGPIGQ